MTDMPVGERKQLAPPVDDSGPFGWARKHLFSSWGNGITTVVLDPVVGPRMGGGHRQLHGLAGF